MAVTISCGPLDRKARRLRMTASGGVMSMRSRARHIQGLAGVSSGRAEELIQGLRERPAQYRASKRWSLHRCDAYLLGLYDEAGATKELSTLHAARCVDCRVEYFAENAARIPTCPFCEAKLRERWAWPIGRDFPELSPRQRTLLDLTVLTWTRRQANRSVARA
jgi:hypothetical protein